MENRTEKPISKKQMIAWAIACAASVSLYGLFEPFTVIFYLIPIFISIVLCLTTLVFIRYKKLKGEEVLKPVCVMLFCIWFILPRAFLPLQQYLPASWSDGFYYWWWDCGIGAVIAGLSILYLVRARKKKTRKYPMVICLFAALFLIFVWGLMV